jgi:nucleoside-diphosphate-sugar epimerase
MRIFLTGATGFIGNAIARAARAARDAGHEVAHHRNAQDVTAAIAPGAPVTTELVEV